MKFILKKRKRAISARSPRGLRGIVAPQHQRSDWSAPFYYRPMCELYEKSHEKSRKNARAVGVNGGEKAVTATSNEASAAVIGQATGFMLDAGLAVVG